MHKCYRPCKSSAVQTVSTGLAAGCNTREHTAFQSAKLKCVQLLEYRILHFRNNQKNDILPMGRRSYLVFDAVIIKTKVNNIFFGACIFRDLRNNEISWAIEDSNEAFVGLDRLNKL